MGDGQNSKRMLLYIGYDKDKMIYREIARFKQVQNGWLLEKGEDLEEPEISEYWEYDHSKEGFIKK